MPPFFQISVSFVTLIHLTIHLRKAALLINCYYADNVPERQTPI